MPLRNKDRILINNLLHLVPLADGSQWPSTTGPQPQPVHLNLSLVQDLTKVAESDNIHDSIDYDYLSTAITNACISQVGSFASLEGLLDRIAVVSFEAHSAIQELCLSAQKPKALLHADIAGIEWSRTRDGARVGLDHFFIHGLKCSTIVGVNASERIKAQPVLLDLSLHRSERYEEPFDFCSLAEKLHEVVQNSTYFTLEALASRVAHEILLYTSQGSDRVTVRAAKPNALVLADSAEVEITRTLTDYGEPVSSSYTAPASETQTSSAPLPTLSSLLSQVSPQLFESNHPLHTAAIALGSNIGDRFANIELALRLLEMPKLILSDAYWQDPEITVVDTSFLYETAPMYVTDQPNFINCACLIETDLDPQTLLILLKRIEKTVGRVPSVRNGPRAVDLDILTYDSEIIDTRPEEERSDLGDLEDQLLIPHPRITEREFVLRPLHDMMPDYILPNSNKSIQTLLREHMTTHSRSSLPMYKVIPFPRYPISSSSSSEGTAASALPFVPPTAKYWKLYPSYSEKLGSAHGKTNIMATLNVTPDSFSDGSTHNSSQTALSYATSSVKAGADVIDIGGYSTRPGAAYVSPDEEISRVVPVIKALRALQADPSETVEAQIKDVMISVDTFRYDVARTAVLAGANCINDVYAFSGPEYPLTTASAEHFLKMREVAKELGVPVVLMHSRGDAGKNKDYSAYSYAADSAVLEGVRVELGDKVDCAVRGKGGLRRWLVIVDPGVGFSKSVEGNLEILRHAAALTSDHRVSGMEESTYKRNALSGYPQLIGASRKSFLGTILERSDPEGTYRGRRTVPQERGWATAAAVSCAVQQGAAVVRVHDALESGDVVRVADTLWR